MSVRRPRWGQNFLVDPDIAQDIVDWAAIDGRAVLEIGPGRGALTERLAGRASRLVLVEIDPRLAAALRVRWATDPRVEVIENDILRTSLEDIAAEPLHVVSNLPYESGTAIVRRLVECPGCVFEAVVMLQKEVCDRMTAAPGTKVYGALSVHMALRADVTAGRIVGPESFDPRPKVESRLLRIRPLAAPRWPHGSEPHFGAILRAAFSGRRKMLRNTLGRWFEGRLGERGSEEAFEYAGVDVTLRPECVSPEQFARLSRRSFELWENRAGAS